jgi:AcrR family transcriptional regulator
VTTVQTDETGAPEGLRARKRRETRHRIAEAGLSLFLAHGFEAVTLDAIAAAADISRRTFFHYFDSKEDILLAWESEAETAFFVAIADEPEGRTPLETVRDGLSKVVCRYETDQAMGIDRLLRSTEGLRARKQGNYERKEQALFAHLIARWPNPERRRDLRLTAMLAIGALRLAAEEWSADGGQRPLIAYLNETFAGLGSGPHAGFGVNKPEDGITPGGNKT